LERWQEVEERRIEDGRAGRHRVFEDAHYPRVVMGVPVRAALLSTVWEEPRAGSCII
jgi:hypothetical protein